MKKTDYMTELRKMPLDELRTRSRALGEEYMKLRFRKASTQLEQSHRLNEVRRKLARTQTVLKETQLAPGQEQGQEQG
jgi:large subunit ribosomal protein L29